MRNYRINACLSLHALIRCPYGLDVQFSLKMSKFRGSSEQRTAYLNHLIEYTTSRLQPWHRELLENEVDHIVVATNLSCPPFDYKRIQRSYKEQFHSQRLLSGST